MIAVYSDSRMKPAITLSHKNAEVLFVKACDTYEFPEGFKVLINNEFV
jgi:hypothetical protein